MRKRKLNPKNEHLKKRISENPEIEKKDFDELLRRAVQPSKLSPKQPD